METPRSYAPTPPKHNSDPFPIPTNTVNGELHQIHAYAAAIKTRVHYLQGLIEPAAVDEVTEMKRVMKDTHRILERLQQRATECDADFIDVGETTVQAWQAYRILVEMEERLRKSDGVVDGRESRVGRENQVPQPVAYVPTGAQRSTVERLPMLTDDGMPTPTELETELEQDGEVYVTPGLVPQGSFGEEVEEEDSMYGASPSPHAYSDGDSVEEQQPGRSPTPSSEYRGEPDDDPLAPTTASLGPHRENNNIEASGIDSGPSHSLSRRHAVRKLYKDEVYQHLGRTRIEVERSIAEEEDVDGTELHDADRQREGSMTGYYVTMFVMCGINDSAMVLPELRFIKVHEVRVLRGWLAKKRYIKRTDDISRLEKLLHLLILLQEGCRYEMIAVLFSRTPRQVYKSCIEVFSGLLELHSETSLPHRQPACDALWNISLVFFNENEIVRNASIYYGWDTYQLISVMVTLNLFIGRYRQQGTFSLTGPYFHWWRAFRDMAH